MNTPSGNIGSEVKQAVAEVVNAEMTKQKGWFMSNLKPLILGAASGGGLEWLIHHIFHVL